MSSIVNSVLIVLARQSNHAIYSFRNWLQTEYSIYYGHLVSFRFINGQSTAIDNHMPDFVIMLRYVNVMLIMLSLHINTHI